jgi:hypothetical protein
MLVECLAQPRLDLVGIAAGGQLDHVRTLSGSEARAAAPIVRRSRYRFA